MIGCRNRAEAERFAEDKKIAMCNTMVILGFIIGQGSEGWLEIMKTEPKVKKSYLVVNLSMDLHRMQSPLHPGIIVGFRCIS